MTEQIKLKFPVNQKTKIDLFTMPSAHNKFEMHSVDSDGRVEMRQVIEYVETQEQCRDEIINKMVEDFLEQDLDCSYQGKIAKVCAALYDAGYRKGE